MAETKETGLVELELDEGALQASLAREERARASKEKAAARRPPDPKLVDKLRQAVERRRPRPMRAEAEEGPEGPTALEAIAGGRIGIAAFAVSRAQRAAKRLFFPGLEAAGEEGKDARERFGHFTQNVATATARAAAVEKVVTVGLPVLSTMIQTGIKDFAGDTPGLKQVADLVTSAMNKITDLVQTAEAEIAGTMRTVREATTLAKGFALTGQDFGKLPDLFAGIRGVNVRQSKLEQDMSEAALREGTAHVAEFVRNAAAETIGDLFSKGGRQ